MQSDDREHPAVPETAEVVPPCGVAPPRGCTPSRDPGLPSDPGGLVDPDPDPDAARSAGVGSGGTRRSSRRVVRLGDRAPRLALVRSTPNATAGPAATAWPPAPVPRGWSQTEVDVDEAELDQAFVAAAMRYWHPIARSQDVGQELRQATLLGVPLVLWRPHASNGVSVLVDQCPHRGVPLSAGTIDAQGRLRCGYHAWLFAGDGRCVEVPQQPGRRIPEVIAARRVRVSEGAGLVWACLVDEVDEAQPRPRFPEVEDEGWPHHVGAVQDWSAQAARQVENFCDVGHLSVVHADTFGNPDVCAVEPYPVHHDRDTVQAEYHYPAVDPLAPPGPDGRRPIRENHLQYRIELPFAVSLAGAHGPGSVMFAVSAPTTATTLRLFWLSAFDPELHGDTPIDAAALQALEDQIWAPDRRIVESQRPTRLFAATEVHRSFDALGVAYRRALRDLGFAPGAGPSIPTPPNRTPPTPTSPVPGPGQGGAGPSGSGHPAAALRISLLRHLR